MIACTVGRPKMLSSLAVFVLAVLPSLVGGIATTVAANARVNYTPANANNKACVVQRILQAIDLLEGASVEAEANANAAAGIVSESTLRAIAILSSITDDLKDDLDLKQDSRRLEEEENDDDDYFQYKEYTDVSVTYNNGNETVVTVSEDVTVIIEHSSYYVIFNLMMCVGCVTLGALMSGLLLGVMTLDPLILGIKARTADTESERRQARSLTPFVQNKNIVLVSVVLVNCAVNEALPVFIERLIENTLYSIALSVSLVVFAGEIVPGAYFTGGDQIKSASRLIPLLRVVIVITSPISYPLAKLMDTYFHESDERATFKRGEISALVRIQHEERLAWKLRKSVVAPKEKPFSPKDYSINCNLLEPLECILTEPAVFTMCSQVESGSTPKHEGGDQEIDDDDINKMEGVLALKTKKVKQAYTPLSSVISITSDTILDEDKIVELYSHGYSRIPVYGSHADEKDVPGICGVLLTKQLILFNKADRRRVSTLSLYQPPAISPETSIAEALNIFQAGSQKSSNMALVCVRPELATAALKKKKPIPSEAGVLGIITLENLLEVLIQEQIYDEKDKKYNRSLERAKWALAKWKVFTLRRRLQREDESLDDDEFGYVKMREIV